MTNTAEIRRANLAHIKQELTSGREYTVRDMSEKTGLSIATCNTILRELTRENIAVYEERQMHDVGRKTCVYHINTSYNSIAYLSCTRDERGGKISLLIGYLYGGQRAYEEKRCDDFSFANVEAYLREILIEHKGISQVVISLPYLPEEDFAKRLQASLAIPVYAARDMDFWIHNHFHSRGMKQKSVSFLRLSKDCPPALFNVYEGKITGRNTSLQYLPHGAEDMVNVVLSVIAVYSPEEIVFVGDEEGESEVQALYQECLAKVQNTDMPPFNYYTWREREYFFGMFYVAAESQGVEL